jgi:hypothetical protein
VTVFVERRQALGHNPGHNSGDQAASHVSSTSDFRVADSERLKSPTHFVDRTAVAMSWAHSEASVVQVAITATSAAPEVPIGSHLFKNLAPLRRLTPARRAHDHHWHASLSLSNRSESYHREPVRPIEPPTNETATVIASKN